MQRITIIGAGPGGYTAAFKAAKAGAAVTLIEQDNLGGTCLNTGCIPTKTLKSSAEALETAHRLKEFGINGGADATVDMPAVVSRKNKVVSILAGGLEKTCASLKISLLRGKATLQEDKKVLVTAQDSSTSRVESDTIILATGSRVLELPTLPFDHTHILSSDDALNLQTVPEKLIIVGGGVIGVELAFIFNAFGSKVTIIEGQNRVLPLPSVDAEISTLLQREMKKKGIAFESGKTVLRAEKTAQGQVCATIGKFGSAPAEETTELVADKLIVTVGRVPNIEGLGLENAGVATDGRGWIIADERMQTSAAGIYAIGDALGPSKVMLAHVASFEALCAVDNCLGSNTTMDYATIPSGIFTSPEIGTVGLTEAEALAKGYRVKTNSQLFRQLGKAQAMGELAGIFKIISDEKTGKLLGVHIVGAHASDLIAEAALAIQAGLSAQDIAHTIHAHPTLAEGFYEAILPLTEEA